MDREFDRILHEVQSLDDESQIAIAEKIICNLPESSEHDLAWRKEIRRRLEEIETGNVELFDAEDVLREGRIIAR